MRSSAIQVLVDQNAARRAGVSSEDIANALNSQLTGVEVTDFRVGDIVIPVVMRAQGDQRQNIDRLRTLNIAVAGSTPVPLLQVARFEGRPHFSRLKRRDLEQVITVSGKSDVLTAAALDQFIAERVTAIEKSLPAGHRIERGGEIESSGEAQGNLFANLPLAFALMVLVLIWQFDSFRKPMVILATIPFVITGVAIGLLIFPGANSASWVFWACWRWPESSSTMRSCYWTGSTSSWPPGAPMPRQSSRRVSGVCARS